MKFIITLFLIGLLNVTVGFSQNKYLYDPYYRDIDKALRNVEKCTHLSINFQEIKTEKFNENITKLSNLQCLKLYYCGNIDYSKFIERISVLPNLHKLEFYGNDTISLPNNLHILSQLRSLRINNTKVLNLGYDFENLKNLEEINLSSNFLKTIPNEIFKLKNLKKINLENNSLKELPTLITGFSNLIELKIQENEITKIPDFIFKIKTLKTLSIDFLDSSYIPTDLLTLDYLDTLYINKYLTFASFEVIAKIKNLKFLSLDNWSKGFSITSNIENLKKLRTLKLEGIKKELRLSFINVCKLSDLEELIWEGYSDTCFTAEIGNLQNLKFLKFEETDLKSLPIEISKLQQLIYLEIDCSAFKGNIKFNKAITDLKRLEYLDLGYNDIDSIPLEIGNMVNLKQLILYGNKIKTIPNTINKLTSLERLELGTNEITEIPNELYLLIKLKDLGLEENKISYISPLLSNLNQIETLNLSGNLLLKNLNIDFTNFKNLESISLKNTQITSLPKSLKVLNQLKEITLSDYLIKHPKKLKKQFNGRIIFEAWNNELDELFNDYEIKYTTTSGIFYKYHDTLELKLEKFYNVPNSIDEENTKLLQFTFYENELKANTVFDIEEVRLRTILGSMSIWSGYEYRDLKGNLKVLKVRKRTIVLKLNVSYLSSYDNTRYVFWDDKITFKLNKNNPESKRIENFNDFGFW